MHASIWTFTGDPDRLLASYDPLVAEVPRTSMRIHACVRTTDGIMLFDTCPTKEIFAEVRGSEWWRDALARHGLPQPRIEDFPVHIAVANGDVVGADR
jgi:hypothetical protein